MGRRTSEIRALYEQAADDPLLWMVVWRAAFVVALVIVWALWH